MANSKQLNITPQILHENDYEIYIEDEKGKGVGLTEYKRILEWNSNYTLDTSPIETKFKVETEEDSLKSSEISEIKKYSRLRSLKFDIESRNVTSGSKDFKAQRVNYILVHEDKVRKSVGKMPNDHWVQFDKANKRLKLIGPNSGQRGSGRWVRTDGKNPNMARKKKRTRFKLSDYTENQRAVNTFITSKWLKKSDEAEEELPIPELPVLWTDAGELICLPISEDEISAAIVGQRGGGKSWIQHAIVDRGYWKYGKNVAILNDRLNETHTWCMPFEDTEVELELQKIGEAPRGLPCVYLHPTQDDGRGTYKRENLDIVYPDQLGFPMSLNKEDVFINMDKFVDLGKTSAGYDSLKNDFLKADSIPQIKEIIDSAVAEKKIHFNSGVKLKNEFQRFYNKALIDSATGEPSRWLVKRGPKKMELNPLVAAVWAGVVPVFRTSKFITSDFFPQYFTAMVEDLYFRQINDPDFKSRNLQVWLVVDEIYFVTDYPMAAKILNDCTRGGRPARMGTIVTTQRWRDIPKGIRSNIKYLFTMMNPRDANTISNDYNIPDFWKDQIKTLDKFECIAVTTEEFVVYDRDGNKSKSKGPFKGKAVPPLSLHKKPKSEEGDDE